MNYLAMPLSQAIWARGPGRFVAVRSALTDHECKASFVFEGEIDAADGSRQYAATWSRVDWREKRRLLPTVSVCRAVNGCRAPPPVMRCGLPP